HTHTHTHKHTHTHTHNHLHHGLQREDPGLPKPGALFCTSTHHRQHTHTHTHTCAHTYTHVHRHTHTHIITHICTQCNFICSCRLNMPQHLLNYKQRWTEAYEATTNPGFILVLLLKCVH